MGMDNQEFLDWIPNCWNWVTVDAITSTTVKAIPKAVYENRLKVESEGIMGMNNIITIALKDAKNEYRHQITFESSPSCTELAAACLVLEEVMEHNFKKEEILSARHLIYGRLEDLEEVKRND